MPIKNPVNDVQREYNELCRRGGGRRGGPVKQRVQKLLSSAGREFNVSVLRPEIQEALSGFDPVNQWHLCFVLGVVWGQFAKKTPDFWEPATRWMSSGDDDLLKQATRQSRLFGPEKLQSCLESGRALFEGSGLSRVIPETLEEVRSEQEKWMEQVLRTKPKYIGNWNFAALFMIALFTRESLWTRLQDNAVVLPTGGPVYRSLKMLHKDYVTKQAPAGNDEDSRGLDPGGLPINQGICAELARGVGGNILDTHGGLYLLGVKKN